MVEIIKATKIDTVPRTITASEILKAPWQDSPSSSQKSLDVSHLDADSRNALQKALEHHGLWTQRNHNSLTIDMSSLSTQQAFDALQEQDPNFRGGISGYGMGPDPTMNDLTVNSSYAAEQNLQRAQTANIQTGRTLEGVTPEEADTLLQSMVQRARNIHFSENNDKIFFPSSIRGACGLGQGLIGHQAELLGLPTYYHQIANLSEDSMSRHAFTVIDIPVKEDDVTTKKTFLVDTTFRQFFVSDYDGYAGGSIGRSWGNRLTETETGKQVADSILRDGYMEVTPETARLYVESQIFDRVAEGEHIPKAWEVNDPLSALRKSNVDNDYDLSEFIEWDYDVRPPSMIIANEPLANIEQKAKSLSAPSSTTRVDTPFPK